MSDLEIQSPVQVSGATTQAPSLTQWQRVTNTFTAPSKTFAEIERGKRSWWMPFLIMSIVAYIFFAAITFKIGMTRVVDNQIGLDSKAQERMSHATPEQRAAGVKISLYVTEGVFLANPVLTLAFTALLSLGLWGTINFVFAGKASYASIFAIWFYASLPSVIKSLLGILVIFAGSDPETFNINNFAPTNLAAFLFPNPLEANKALYVFSSWLDVTSLWTLVLLGIGTATVAGVKRSSGYIAVFGWWVIFLLVSSPPALPTHGA
jgi:hypothetical protein